MVISINNAFNASDFKRFFDHATNIDQQINFILEPKIDGSSISLIYQNNQLVKAVTRGDGEIGENIIMNVKTIRNIPLTIENGPGDFEVRGEIFINKDDFQLLNQTLASSGQKTLMNPRNAATGALRLQNPNEVAKKPLRAIFYQLIAADTVHGLTTQLQVHKQLQKWGLPTFNFKHLQVVKELEKLTKVINDFCEQKNQLPFLCDGLVIKVNQIKNYPTIGYTSKYPK